jgi:hypothetical protein
LSAEVPLGVTTATFTLPALVGAVAVMTSGETTEKSDDAFVPKYTALAELNPVPVI